MKRSIIPHALGLSLLTTWASACGGDGQNKPAAQLIEGGGIANGGIDGRMNVFVLDDATRGPISGATVRVGASADTNACSGTTDSTGLVVFDDTAGCTILKGKQQVTASATDHVPATWIGVDGANITMMLRPRTVGSLPAATVSGTIAGWDDLPAPAANHNLIGMVLATSAAAAGDSANNMEQGTRNVLLVVPVPANACVRNALVNDCNWTLKTRTGKLAVYALILDQDTKGTSGDDSDDTWTSVGFALKTGYVLSDGQSLSGEQLPIIPDADTTTLTVNFNRPAALDYTIASPSIELGDEGRMAVLMPGAKGTSIALRVPRLTGTLAAAHMDVLTGAQTSADDDAPAALTWHRGVDPAQPVTADDWLPSPTGLAVTAGTYSFSGVAGAKAYTVELRVAKGEPRWNITVLDDSSSFALPGLSPDPLPTGALEMVVTALDADGVDLRNVRFTELVSHQLTRAASDRLDFTH